MKNLRLISKSFTLLYKIAPLPLISLATVQAVIIFSNPIDARLSKLLFDTVGESITTGWNTAAKKAAVLVIVLYFIYSFIRMISLKLRDISLTYANTKISAGIQQKIIARLMKTPYIKYEDSSFYNAFQTANNENSGGNLLEINMGLTGVITQLGSMLIMSVMLARFSPVAVIIAIACCTPGFLHQHSFGGRNYEFATANIPLMRKMNYFFNLVTSRDAFKENKLYNLSPYYMKKHNKLFDEYYHELKSFNSQNCCQGVILALIHACGTAFVVFWIYLSAAEGKITIGEAVMYAGLAKSLYSGVQDIVYMFGGITYSLKMSGNLIDFLESGETYVHLSENHLLEDSDDIVVDRLHFTYPGSKAEVLKGVSCRIRQGQKVAIVGRNGSGKTTLVKLLTGLYSADKGSIYVKGRDLASVDQPEIAGMFSVCFQDYNIFSYTVRENIGFGNMSMLKNDDHIIDAACKSGFIQVLNDVGAAIDHYINRDFAEDGLVLSGGQQQKLALARAFAGKGSIVFFDEPSASLDIISENEIFERTLNLIKGKTMFFITHRLANVVSADVILFLKDGIISEQGTHKELIALNGDYAALFKLQAEKYIAG